MLKCLFFCCQSKVKSWIQNEYIAKNVVIIICCKIKLNCLWKQISLRSRTFIHTFTGTLLGILTLLWVLKQPAKINKNSFRMRLEPIQNTLMNLLIIGYYAPNRWVLILGLTMNNLALDWTILSSEITEIFDWCLFCSCAWFPGWWMELELDREMGINRESLRVKKVA